MEGDERENEEMEEDGGENEEMEVAKGKGRCGWGAKET